MTTKLLAALAVSVAVLASAAEARADEPASAPEKPQTESRWYGYQTLAADGSALVLLTLAVNADSKGAQQGFATAGLAAYGIAPSVIHAAHGNTGRALGDLALRTLTPVAVGFGGALLGAAASDEGWSRLAGVVVGGVAGIFVGTVTAITIDAAVLAREDVPVEKTRPTAKSFTVTPNVGPTRSGFAAGLSGTF